MAPLRPHRLTRLTAAEVIAALIAAIVIAALGTGLGVAAVHVNHQQSQTPLQIIRPNERVFQLHRDQPRYVP
jgi:hypothetical protein